MFVDFYVTQDDVQSYKLRLPVYVETVSWESWYDAACDQLQNIGAPTMNSIEIVCLKQRYGNCQLKVNHFKKKKNVTIRINKKYLPKESNSNENNDNNNENNNDNNNDNSNGSSSNSSSSSSGSDSVFEVDSYVTIVDGNSLVNYRGRVCLYLLFFSLFCIIILIIFIILCVFIYVYDMFLLFTVFCITILIIFIIFVVCYIT